MPPYFFRITVTLSYAILVVSSPNSQGPTTAANFIRAALNNGHSIYRVFFLADGVLCGRDAPGDEQQQLWQSLQQDHALDLVLCSSSAIQRQVLDNREAKRQNLPATIASGFCLSGLGQWLDACEQADRILRFGN